MSLYSVVFLADDDIDDREMFMDALKEIDDTIQCVCANDGEHALKTLSDNLFQRPDLIFLDFNMPYLNGKQVLAALKQKEGLRHIPVVIYSTHIGKSDMEEMKQLGAAHFITKPTEFNMIVELLKFVLARKW